MPSKGIIVLSIVPVRSDKSDAAEIVNQLLFGDFVEIIQIDVDSSWVKIKSLFDDYEGYIDSKQVEQIKDSTYWDLTQNSTYNLGRLGIIKKNGFQIPITIGCMLPNMVDNHFEINSDNYTFIGDRGRANAKHLVEFSFTFLGAPYLWGGKSPFGVDCSGFTQVLFRMCGIKLPRDASQQALLGKEVSFSNSLETDLAFFKNKGGSIIHVGMILGENKIIHAHGEVRIDHFDEKGIVNTSLSNYSHELAFIKRLT